ncbi:DUF883 family protein [Dechloromonas sp. A34]|uniref:DUF883 family protein n=1 Tax=Dechloromonas sp. A34 TaxID=447588 RepID=UPI002248AB3B|nr:hypothetical protein [Dechloromonas sp. A34]
MKHSAENLPLPVAKLAITAEQAHQAIDQLSEAARPAVWRTAASAHQMVDRISGASDRVAQRLERTATRLKDAEQHLLGASRSYAHDNPLKMAGIALAAGFLISLLISSGKSTRGSAK